MKSFLFRKACTSYCIFCSSQLSNLLWWSSRVFWEFYISLKEAKQQQTEDCFHGNLRETTKYFILNPDSRLLVPFHYFILYWSLHWRWRTGKMLKCKQTLKNTQTCQSGRRMEKGSILKPESDVSYMINMIYDCWL